MTTYAAANPYELWSTRKSIGIMRDVQAENWYFAQFFTNQLLSEEEWVDFEKLPIMKRKLAPFVMPKARGRGVWEDSQRSYRFKPAYSKVEENIDPLMPLTFTPGLGQSAFDMNSITPMQRIELIRAQMMVAMISAVQRRWEWMRARAIIDGGYTVSGVDYPAQVLSFGRAAGHTVVLGSGSRFGESGVSIVDFFQGVVDTMNNAEFGGIPTRATMGSAVAAVMRKDAEVLAQMDINIVGGTIRVERGLVSGGANGGKVYKFGEMRIGGASGAVIELWVNDEEYVDDSGTKQRYLGAKEVVFTASPDSIMGYQAFGRIVDRDAEYRAVPIFPKNFFTGDDEKTEHLSLKSAPLMVPINPNATFKATVLA